jgi:hypothetical protein
MRRSISYACQSSGVGPDGAGFACGEPLALGWLDGVTGTSTPYIPSWEPQDACSARSASEGVSWAPPIALFFLGYGALARIQCEFSRAGRSPGRRAERSSGKSRPKFVPPMGHRATCDQQLRASTVSNAHRRFRYTECFPGSRPSTRARRTGRFVIRRVHDFFSSHCLGRFRHEKPSSTTRSLRFYLD